MNRWVVCIIVILRTTHAQGESLSQAGLPVAAMGRGHAGTAVSQDGAALWTNPAGIARVRRARNRKPLNLLRLPTITAGYSPGGKTYLSAVQAQAAEREAKLSEALADTDALSDHSAWAGTQIDLAAYFDLPRGHPWLVALGTFNTLEVAGYNLTEEDPRATSAFRSDTYAVVGTAWTNRTNRLSFGIQARPIQRYHYQDDLALSELAARSASDYRQALVQGGANLKAVALDAGLMFTLADFWFPTFGIAIFNLPSGCRSDYLNPYSMRREKICGTPYSGSGADPNSRAWLDPTDIRVGFSILPRLGRKLALRLAVDAYPLALSPDTTTHYGLPQVPAEEKIHGGVELVFGNPLEPHPLALRLGINQTRQTYGFSTRLGWLTTEVARYAMLRGTGSDASEEVRWLASVAIDLR